MERGRSSGAEHNLAKVGVVSSNLIARSKFSSQTHQHTGSPRGLPPAVRCRVADRRHPAASAAKSIPSTFITASVVVRGGLPFSLKDRQRRRRDAGRRLSRDVRHGMRSEEHTSELRSLMRLSYAVFCLKKKK